MAPLAHHDLTAEIDVDAVPVEDVWAQEIAGDPDDGAAPELSVIAWVDAEARPEVAAWLEGSGGNEAESEVRTDWIFLPAGPEAILIGVVEGGEPTAAFRFNVRFAADPYRQQLEALARSGLLGLTTVPIEIGPEQQLESPCVFVEVQARLLRDFLRDLPAPPAV